MREKEVEQTQAACLDLKRKEGREEILAARSERRVDVCSLRRPQHCDCSVTVRTLGRCHGVQPTEAPSFEMSTEK